MFISNAMTASTVTPSEKIESIKNITSRKIGKITYEVVSTYNSTGTETAKQKIEKLIMRECDRLIK